MAGEKRSNESDEILLEETTILLDIEGTTTSISFVKDKLFPYVRENLKKYIDEKWSQDEFKADLEKLKEQAKKDEEAKVSGFLPISGTSPEEEKDSLVKNILWQMDEDRKTGALKQFQGHMWRQAYETGEIKGHVYDDVPKALESWTNGGRKIYIYSSGSVESQKLLFSHSQNNDLTKYLSGYFDTEVGDKQEANSYKNILNKINVPASSVLFLTDVVKEAKAAKEAGLSATLVIREGNAPISDEEKSSFTTIKSFDDLSFKILSKRQKIDADDEKKDSKVSEPAKTDVAEKTECKEKSQVDTKTENEKPCEPMDTSDDISEKIAENKTAKVTDNESKDVTEPEQKEKEKETEKEKEKENVKEKEQVPEKMTVDDSKESTDAKSEKSKDEVTKTAEEKKSEEKMSLDEPTTKTKEAEKKIDEPVVETVKKSLPDDKKETVVESNTKTEEKTEKSETDAKTETSEKPKEVEEKKVETTTEETKDKIPEIVVDKAPEVEKETEKPEVKENGGVKEEKPAETESKKEVEQPELRSEKPAEEKEKENEKVEEKEEVKKEEVEKKKEEESKVNGTSNGEGKHSNGVDEKEKPETKTTDPTSSQNGDAETADSAEAIKVKKVVDSTVADGAGEPEVVTPPVAVAATS